MRPARRLAGEEGLVLPIVLAFLALFALSVVALLGWATTSFSLTRHVRDLGGRIFAADGGTEYAIARARGDVNVGATDSRCNPDIEPNATYTMTLNGAETTVEVEGQPGSADCLIENDAQTTPFYTLLALGGPRVGGIDFRSKDVEMDFAGPIHSNDDIKAGPKDVTVADAGPEHPSQVTAVVGPGGDCLHILAAVENCGGAAPVADPRSDPDLGPGWDLPADLDPTMPGDQGPGDIEERGIFPSYGFCPAGTPANFQCFQPGRYVDEPKMEASQTTIYWFLPGYYYFAFDGKVDFEKKIAVAGKLSPGVDDVTDFPGACTTEGDEEPWARGAEWILGGKARIEIDKKSSIFEMCAMPWKDRQRIAVYGVHASPPAGYTAHTRDMVLTTKLEGGSEIYIKGTIYAPTAKVKIELKKEGTLGLERGVIANVIEIKESKSKIDRGPVVSVPPLVLAGVTDRTILVRTTADVPGTARVMVRALVRFDAQGNEEPTVRSWWLSGPGSG